MDNQRTHSRWDDAAFAGYLASIAGALLAGLVFVLALDLEGKTKLAATVALLLPILGLAAVVAYVLANPLTQRARERD